MSRPDFSKNIDLLRARFIDRDLRVGRVYPELSSQGLVASAMHDFYRTNLPILSTVVLSDTDVAIELISADVDTGRITTPYRLSMPIEVDDPVITNAAGEQLSQHANDLKTREAYRLGRLTLEDIVGDLAEKGSAHDALHGEVHANTYPPAPVGQERLYPYAGLPYGARLNFMTLYAITGHIMHPAVQEVAAQRYAEYLDS